jgi:hypothetical protein
VIAHDQVIDQPGHSPAQRSEKQSRDADRRREMATRDRAITAAVGSSKRNLNYKEYDSGLEQLIDTTLPIGDESAATWGRAGFPDRSQWLITGFGRWRDDNVWYTQKYKIYFPSVLSKDLTESCLRNMVIAEIGGPGRWVWLRFGRNFGRLERMVMGEEARAALVRSSGRIGPVTEEAGGGPAIAYAQAAGTGDGARPRGVERRESGGRRSLPGSR